MQYINLQNIMLLIYISRKYVSIYNLLFIEPEFKFKRFFLMYSGCFSPVVHLVWLHRGPCLLCAEERFAKRNLFCKFM